MKATDKTDELRPLYDSTSLQSGVRGKYLERLQKGSNFVLLEPDVASLFPDAKSVNNALRKYAQRPNTKNRREAA